MLSCVSTQLGSTSLRGAEDVPTTKALPIGKGLVSKADSTRLNVNTVVVERCRVMIMDRVTLASPRAGVLDTVGLREGDTVKHSQVVASLDSSIARAQLAIAKLKSQSTVDIRFANEAIELSRVEYERALKANGKIDGAALFTEFDLRRLKLAVDKAVLMKEQAERESQVLSLTVTQLEAELKTYSVEAPFAGIVTRVHRNKGEAVTLGEPIIEVVNLDRVRVEGFVPARDGLRLKRGLPVTVRLDLPDADLPETQRELNGRLANVDVGVEPVSGQIRISAEVPNPDGLLRAGLLTRLTVLVSEPIIEQTAGQTNDPRLK
jgi:macrolide-specific efflux system membrane fusion protein